MQISAALSKTGGTGVRGLTRGWRPSPARYSIFVLKVLLHQPTNQPWAKQSICRQNGYKLIYVTTVNYFQIPFSAMPVKKLAVILLVVTIWLQLCTSYSSSCHHYFQYPWRQ